MGENFSAFKSSRQDEVNSDKWAWIFEISYIMIILRYSNPLNNRLKRVKLGELYIFCGL